MASLATAGQIETSHNAQAFGRPATGWEALTDVERQVAQLVVERLANREVAERLFLSRTTLETDLKHVFAKLGIAARTELAALAPSDRSRIAPSSACSPTARRFRAARMARPVSGGSSPAADGRGPSAGIGSRRPALR